MSDNPVTTVHKQEHWRRLSRLVIGHIDVQLLPFVVAVGQVQGHAGTCAHLVGPCHCLLQVLWSTGGRLRYAFRLFNHDNFLIVG